MKRNIVIVLLTLVILIPLMMLFYVNKNNKNEIITGKNATNQKISLEDVSKHNTKVDCWMVIDKKVYDVTSFIALGKHPPAIELGCGKDATKLFKERTMENGTKIGSGTPHSKKANDLLKNYYIGDLSS